MNIRDVKVVSLGGFNSSASAHIFSAVSTIPNASLAKKDCLLLVSTYTNSGSPTWTVALSESSTSGGSYTATAGAADFATIQNVVGTFAGTTTYSVRPIYQYQRFEVAVATAGSGAIMANLLLFNREST